MHITAASSYYDINRFNSIIFIKSNQIKINNSFVDTKKKKKKVLSSFHLNLKQ